MKYALDHPARVKQIALIGSGTLATALGIERGREGPRPPRFDGTRESVRKAVELLINDPAMITDEMLDSRMAVAVLPGQQHAHDSIQRFRQMLTDDPDQFQVYDVRARLPRLTVPWCMIWGSADVSAPLDPVGLAMHDMFPEVPFHIVDGSGHQVQNDKPDECNRLLLEFFGVAAPALVAR
jgi:pimeloyl-ACP methyl ester carboxylesterase